MHLHKKKKSIENSLLLTVIVFVAVIIFFAIAFSNVTREVDSNEVKTLITALDNAVVTNYAINGVYPESLSEIEEKYGVIIDYDRFIVQYDIISTNIMPNISVFIKEAE
ncbi:MAG: hypothetical protein K2M73_02390 [Lachnospiraceae bacterium]|nr:hypothetical protein [Lachnospiraceae bacterium]